MSPQPLLAPGQRLELAPERPELVADEVERRDEDDRDRLGRELVQAALDERSQQGEVRAVRDEGDDQEAQPLVRHVPALPAEGPEAGSRGGFFWGGQKKAGGGRA